MKKTAICTILCIFTSCNDDAYRQEVSEYYVANFERLKQTKEYKTVLKNAKDTIDSWYQAYLEFYTARRNAARKDSIDPWIYLNSKKNKVILFHLKRSFRSKTQDYFEEILGEKIDGEWWFYGGSNHPVIQRDWDTERDGYVNDSTRIALRFNTLGRISRRVGMRWYYKRWFPEFVRGEFKEAWRCFTQRVINDFAFDDIDWELEHEHYLKVVLHREWHYRSEQDSLSDVELRKLIKKHPNYWEEDNPEKADSLAKVLDFPDWNRKFDSVAKINTY